MVCRGAVPPSTNGKSVGLIYHVDLSLLAHRRRLTPSTARRILAGWPPFNSLVAIFISSFQLSRLWWLWSLPIRMVSGPSSSFDQAKWPSLVVKARRYGPYAWLRETYIHIHADYHFPTLFTLHWVETAVPSVQFSQKPVCGHSYRSLFLSTVSSLEKKTKNSSAVRFKTCSTGDTYMSTAPKIPSIPSPARRSPVCGTIFWFLEWQTTQPPWFQNP